MGKGGVKDDPQISSLRDDNAIRICKTGGGKNWGKYRMSSVWGYIDLEVPGQRDVDIFRTIDVDFRAEESQ